MSIYKKSFFFLINFIILFLLVEIFAFSLFKIYNYDKKFNLYSEKRISSLKYNYYKNIQLALPSPNIDVVHYTSEFTDRFKTKDVLNLGFGLFDDGIDLNKKYYAVALGDSFTRGTGSGDNIKNGWVELVEKETRSWDILNLGNLGRSITDQKYGYDLLKDKIKHEIIIYNFFTGGDYYENTSDNSSAYYLNKKITEKKMNLNEIKKEIDNLQIYHGYDPSFEYLLESKYKSYGVWLLIKISIYSNMTQILPEKYLPEIYNKPYRSFNDYYETRMNLVPDDIYELGKKVNKSSKSYKIDNKTFHVKLIYKDKEIAKKIVNNSIKQIKDFINQSKNENKKFILIIHPSQNDTYESVLKEKIETNVSFMREQLIEGLKRDILVLDLTNYLKKYITKNTRAKLYWDRDGHYTPLGYEVVSKIITNFLNANFKNKN